MKIHGGVDLLLTEEWFIPRRGPVLSFVDLFKIVRFSGHKFCSCGILKAPLQIVGMKFLDWYLKIAIGSALVGGSMEFFMIKTGFYDKVTVLESEKRAWETSPEALAVKEALNPWRKHDEETGKSS
ncbi:hypothetical protein QYF36_025592 [Acer negundo]|nr:hypothetical protein QYF36_025592 [Acer negundo]